MRPVTRTQRLIAVALAVWHLPSCATTRWQTQTIVPQETKRTMYVGDVRVTTTGGTTHAFQGVWVSADSLGGWLVEPAGVERAFALTEVEAMQVRHARGLPQPAGSRASRETKLWTLAGLAVVVVLPAVFCGALGRSCR